MHPSLLALCVRYFTARCTTLPKKVQDRRSFTVRTRTGRHRNARPNTRSPRRAIGVRSHRIYNVRRPPYINPSDQRYAVPPTGRNHTNVPRAPDPVTHPPLNRDRLTPAPSPVARQRHPSGFGAPRRTGTQTRIPGPTAVQPHSLLRHQRFTTVVLAQAVSVGI